MPRIRIPQRNVPGAPAIAEPRFIPGSGGEAIAQGGQALARGIQNLGQNVAGLIEDHNRRRGTLQLAKAQPELQAKANNVRDRINDIPDDVIVNSTPDELAELAEGILLDEDFDEVLSKRNYAPRAGEALSIGIMAEKERQRQVVIPELLKSRVKEATIGRAQDQAREANERLAEDPTPENIEREVTNINLYYDDLQKSPGFTTEERQRLKNDQERAVASAIDTAVSAGMQEELTPQGVAEVPYLIRRPGLESEVYDFSRYMLSNEGRKKLRSLSPTYSSQIIDRVAERGVQVGLQLSNSMRTTMRFTEEERRAFRGDGNAYVAALTEKRAQLVGYMELAHSSFLDHAFRISGRSGELEAIKENADSAFKSVITEMVDLRAGLTAIDGGMQIGEWSDPSLVSAVNQVFESVKMPAVIQALRDPNISGDQVLGEVTRMVRNLSYAPPALEQFLTGVERSGDFDLMVGAGEMLYAMDDRGRGNFTIDEINAQGEITRKLARETHAYLYSLGQISAIGDLKPQEVVNAANERRKAAKGELNRSQDFDADWDAAMDEYMNDLWTQYFRSEGDKPNSFTRTFRALAETIYLAGFDQSVAFGTAADRMKSSRWTVIDGQWVANDITQHYGEKGERSLLNRASKIVGREVGRDDLLITPVDLGKDSLGRQQFDYMVHLINDDGTVSLLTETATVDGQIQEVAYVWHHDPLQADTDEEQLHLARHRLRELEQSLEQKQPRRTSMASGFLDVPMPEDPGTPEVRKQLKEDIKETEERILQLEEKLGMRKDESEERVQERIREKSRRAPTRGFMLPRFPISPRGPGG